MFKNWNLTHARSIVRSQMTNKPSLPRCPPSSEKSILPEKFNFRTAYPQCASPIFT